MQATATDDAQVLDRRDLVGPITADTIISEADRLAIEAVRRSEDARSAAARAERMAAQAKVAADAARIAAEAATLARGGNLAAASQWLEEARKVELLTTRGPLDAQGSTQRIAQSGPTTAPPPSPQGPLPVAPPSQGFTHDAIASSTLPSAMVPSRPPAPPLAPTDMAPAAFDAASFRTQLKPSIAGLPPLAIVGIVIVGLCLVFLLFWMIFA